MTRDEDFDSTNSDVDEPPEPFGGPRRRYLFVATGGVGLLAMNHALALLMDRVYLEAAIVGSICLTVGVFGMIVPTAAGPTRNLSRPLWDDIKRVPLWVNLTGGAAALAGLALGLWLFFGFYDAH